MCVSRLSFGSQYKFPLKLFEIANDGIVIKWTDDGKGLVVEEFEFERNVMLLYPGFVQVKTFHNLRRLFRDYNFKFRVLRKRKPYGAKIEFRHPFFIRDSPVLVYKVKKSKRWHHIKPNATSSPIEICKKWRMFRHSHRQSSKCNITKSSLNLTGDTNEISSPIKSTDIFDSDLISSTLSQRTKHSLKITFDNRRATKPKVAPPPAASHPEIPHPIDLDIFRIIQNFAKNELTEAEYWEVVTKMNGQHFQGDTWESSMDYLDSIVSHDLSPLHFKGYFYELSLSEM